MQTAPPRASRGGSLCEDEEVDTDELLRRVMAEGEALRTAEASALMTTLLAGELSEREMEDLLTTLHERGETAEELAGFAKAMRAASVKLPLTDEERDSSVDTCGTGGDGSGSFNISTAVALVAAAAGVKIAKHGNRSITSRCGSADVLEALGVPIDHSPAAAVQALREHGFAFLLAPRMHPGMKAVAAVRRRLPFRTVFNLLGPLVNPAGARRQLIGVYEAEAVPKIAEALAVSGSMLHAMVVHGADGMDEISLAGETMAATVRGTEIHRHSIVPEDAGVLRWSGTLPGGGVEENASILRAIFAGETGPARDVVVLNAAAVFQAASRSGSLREGAELAASVLRDGGVERFVAELAMSR